MPFYSLSIAKRIELDDLEKKTSPLTELVTEGFDHEQIWQELELQNIPTLKFFTKKVQEMNRYKNEIDFDLEVISNSDISFF